MDENGEFVIESKTLEAVKATRPLINAIRRRGFKWIFMMVDGSVPSTNNMMEFLEMLSRLLLSWKKSNGSLLAYLPKSMNSNKKLVRSNSITPTPIQSLWRKPGIIIFSSIT